MISPADLNIFLTAWIAIGVVIFFVLFFTPAPYGRHIRPGWGPTLANRTGWILMEAPAVFVFGAMFLSGVRPYTVTSIVFLLMWQAHYVHRALVFPFTLRGDGKRMPVVTAMLAILFNTVNGSVNGFYLFSLSGGYPVEWLYNPRFLLGSAFFVTGFIINRRSDGILRNLRADGNSGYRIPDKGLFRRVSSPNYLGEIVQWAGWAIATWSLAGLAFAIWTAANLVPRARSNHRWYRDTFPEYPPDRKALIPGIW